MREIASTITSKGQITIPAEIRRHMGVRQGSKIAFVIEPDGSVRLKTPDYPNIDSLRGAAGSLKKPLNWDEVLEIAREDELKENYGEKP